MAAAASDGREDFTFRVGVAGYVANEIMMFVVNAFCISAEGA